MKRSGTDVAWMLNYWISNATAVITVCLLQGCLLCQVTLPEAPRFQIEGTVSDGVTGNGIDNAEVVISGASGESNLNTEKNGVFSLRGLAPGSYTVFSRKPGYSGPISKLYTVRLGQESSIARLDIRLSKESIVTGHVLDFQKIPVSQVRVHISKEVYRDGRLVLTNRGETFTDVKGKYRFGGLDEGKYFVDVDAKRPEVELVAGNEESDPAMRPVHTFYPNVTSQEAAAPLTVHAGDMQTDVDLSMAVVTTHCVRGTLSGAQKSLLTLWIPLPGGYRPLTGKEIAPAGRFRICDLGEGSYRLTLGTVDQRGGTSSLLSLPFSVGRRDVDLGILAPHPGASISGRVLVDGAQPKDQLPDGLLVSAVPAEYTTFVNEQLDASVTSSGHFAIPNLLGSDYWIQLSHVPPGYYIKSATLGSHDARRETVSPGEGQLDILLAKDGGVVKGSVVGKNGKALVGADVVLTPADLPPIPYRGFVQATVTDQNGAFQFQGVEPGDYKLIGVSDLNESEIENPDLLRSLLSAGEKIEVSPNAALQSKLVSIEAHSR